MSRRRKREQYRNHDSGRWLKQHPPRYSAPDRYLKPEEEWIDDVRLTVSSYQALKEEYETLLLCPSFRSGRCGPSAETGALYVLPKGKQRRLDAVEAARRSISREEDGKAKVALINMLYLKKTHGVVTAARSLGISEGTARRWIRRFRRAVALNLGYGGAQDGG